ncbi:hypothetical protein JJQ72_10765 [Paenibacillus sp. F411]|uniref:hypothetical protein n=1 Tax=Paenibacillus sp. F411 TaxID=2820239 RepID=UPI001AAE576C|nr:hypothetical protein [Paenibacillus sp. F411]MBO2944451.1 hypothetical protein [Paenibacillus sp. F411]
MKNKLFTLLIVFFLIMNIGCSRQTEINSSLDISLLNYNNIKKGDHYYLEYEINITNNADAAIYIESVKPLINNINEDLTNQVNKEVKPKDSIKIESSVLLPSDKKFEITKIVIKKSQEFIFKK